MVLDRKWTAGVRGRYFSCSFDFKTFRDALDYIQEQQSQQAKKKMLRDFWYWIEGPGGRIQCHELQAIVCFNIG